MVREVYKYMVTEMVMMVGERREWQCWHMARYMVARIEREVWVMKGWIGLHTGEKEGPYQEGHQDCT